MSSYYDNKKLTVINFWAGPGAGKSTTNAGLFNLMKRDYVDVELVTEYAKDLVWSERGKMFTEQDYIFAKQNHRLRRLVGKVEYAVTDSPFALGCMYAAEDYPLTFKPFVMECFNSYKNINIFLGRKHKYIAKGRNETEEQAKKKDEEIKHFLDVYRLPYIEFPSSEDTAKDVYVWLKKEGLINVPSI